MTGRFCFILIIQRNQKVTLKKINQLVYQLYELNENDIKIIEAGNG